MKQMPKSPLISCICITSNGPQLLVRTIASFAEQTYPHKELVISCVITDTISKELINNIMSHEPLNIITVERKKEDSIGKARNDAIASTNGEYVCMWDDDDLYHQTRLEEQYHVLQEIGTSKDASILTRILFYHSFENTAYISFPSYWAGTLLCKKEHFLSYPCKDINEFEFISILNFLRSNDLLYPIFFSPSLYTFVFQGTNIMKYTTFLQLINLSEIVQQEVSGNIKSYLDLWDR